MKLNLPVIAIKNIILLPFNEIRIELENNYTRTIVDMAELFHNNKVLVVTQLNPLEQNREAWQLPSIGVIAKIKHKMELPNGNLRITLLAEARAQVLEYLNIQKAEENLESFIAPIEKIDNEKSEETFFVNKVKKELNTYIKHVPYMSNSITSLIENKNDLDEITDLIVPSLSPTFERSLNYLFEKSSLRRCEMILEDIYHEMEAFNIEKALDTRVRNGLDKTQKEIMLKEKLRFIKEELGEENNLEYDKYIQKLENSNLPKSAYNRTLNEIKRFELLPPSSPEINISRNYIEWMLELPWNKQSIDETDLKKIKQKLDQNHQGLEEIKTRIIEYLAVKQMSSNIKAPIICLVGPPGVGKTSLAVSIAVALNRKFVKIAAGGMNDESEIKGHRRTYLGSSPGRIISCIKAAKTNNPIFLIDEIDKMRHDMKGDPSSTLLDILDPEQNKYFSDNYIEEEFDLSNVMFITTANCLDEIPEALKDRLEIINLPGYTYIEKENITVNHLIPKLLKSHGLSSENVTFTKEAVNRIINSYTKESGVRELQRQVEKVIRKIVTSIITNNIKRLVNLEVNEENLTKYLGKEIYEIKKVSDNNIGVVNGVSYTKLGGDILPIEVTFYKGKGKIILTGSLGSVLKESSQIALSYVKSNYKEFGVDFNQLVNNDIHIHIPEGSIKKDGPSAGVAITTAIISAFAKMQIPSSVAMTGEITLHGKVLPIGGLKEKLIGANRAGISTIFVPLENEKEVIELTDAINNSINIIYIQNYLEIFKYLKNNTK